MVDFACIGPFYNHAQLSEVLCTFNLLTGHIDLILHTAVASQFVSCIAAFLQEPIRP